MVNNLASSQVVPAGLGAGQVGQESAGISCSKWSQPTLTHSLLPDFEISPPFVQAPVQETAVASTSASPRARFLQSLA